MDSDDERTGGCLCGAVRYRTKGPLRQIIGCHCNQCRRTTGHYMAATAVRSRHFRLERESGLTWYRTSDKARRGFCSTCGANLFWAPDHGGHLSIVAGTLDDTTGLKLVAHIFVGNKGSYYELEDTIPAHQDDSAGTVPLPD